LKLPLEKSALHSGILLSVAGKVSFTGNLMFGGNVIREVVGGLGCGAVIKECRTGRQMRLGRESTPLRTLIVD
jgi:hypothetical protein